jgi:hypothetical protein
MIGGVPTWTGGTPPPQIGDFRDGGVVFYVDATGQHGLVCAVSDQGFAQWGCYVTTISGADGTAIGTGAQNTLDIINGCSYTGTAARICADLTLNGYNDWFLPSKDELNAMYQNKAIIETTAIANGGTAFIVDFYWSSSESNFDKAWEQYFPNGNQFPDFKDYNDAIRAVRAF